MADYFEELGHAPTPDHGPDDFDKHYRRLQVLAIMNGIDIEIEPPEASKQAIEKLPVYVCKGDEKEAGENLECSVCKSPAAEGDIYKILPCKHKFHAECILLWLKKANSCPLCRYELETDDEAYEELRKFNQAAPERKERLNDLMDSMFS